MLIIFAQKISLKPVLCFLKSKSMVIEKGSMKTPSKDRAINFTPN
jgi:hypothetical protein